MRLSGLALVIAAAGLVASGCGLDIRPADLFLLTRTGQGRTLTLLVSDGGTISCNGGPRRRLPDPLLLRARDLAGALAADARAHLRIPSPTASVFRYTIRLKDGTVAFPDTAASRHPVLARAELFAAQAAQQACRLKG